MKYIIMIIIVLMCFKETYSQTWPSYGKKYARTYEKVQRRHAHSFHGCNGLMKRYEQGRLYSSNRRRNK